MQRGLRDTLSPHLLFSSSKSLFFSSQFAPSSRQPVWLPEGQKKKKKKNTPKNYLEALEQNSVQKNLNYSELPRQEASTLKQLIIKFGASFIQIKF